MSLPHLLCKIKQFQSVCNFSLNTPINCLNGSTVTEFKITLLLAKPTGHWNIKHFLLV